MKRTWLILVSALLLTACSSQGSGPIDGSGGSGGDAGAGGAAGDGGAGGAGGEMFTYPNLDCDPLVPEFCGYPFPSNVYTIADDATPTGRRVSFGPGLLRGENQSGPWDTCDGFSAGTPILTALPGLSGVELNGETDIDASLETDSPTIVLDAESGELVPHFAEIDIRAPTAEQRSLVIRPVVRLKDDTRYIVAARNLTNEDGMLIEASDVFAALRDETSSEDPSVEPRRDVYEDIFKKLGEAGWAREGVQIAWDFNTASDQNNTQWMLHMRDEALQLVENDGGIQYRITSEDFDFQSDNIAVRIEGEYRVPLYTNTPDTGALLNFGEDGMPEVNPDMPWTWVPFLLLIPNSATEEDPAAIVEYGHGLFGAKEEPTYGSQRHHLSFMNTYNYAYASADLWGMESEDRTTAGAMLLTGQVSLLTTMFERLHQGFLNYVLLMRMMKESFANDPEYGRSIKSDEAYYYGISQGGIMGGVFLALTNDVERGALGVMGQPYSLLLFRATGLAPFLEIIEMPYPDKRMQQLLVALYQMLWDRVEPNGYNHHITQNTLPGSNPKTVLTRIAVGDHQVTNLAAHLMARTLNATHVDTGLTRDVWGVGKVSSTAAGESPYFEYDFGLPEVSHCNFPMILCDDPHELPRRRTAARIQLDEFLRNGTGTNRCDPEDGDEPVTAPGVCSYPSLSGCEPEEDDEAAQAICTPGVSF